MTSVVVALGAALHPTAQRLDLGPEHPSRAGVVEIDLTHHDGVVTSASVRPGAIHRNVEKLLEVRDYRQILSLANRHDWQASFTGELGAALAIEAALGLETPPRATWLRMLLAELARLGSHLAFLSAVPDALLPDEGLSRRLRDVRGGLRSLTLEHTGNRIHPMVARLGGLSADVPAGWLDRARGVAAAAAAVAGEIDDRLSQAGLPCVAVLDRATIAAHGVTGPAARASGVDLDLRCLQAYLAYADLSITSVVGGTGDAVDRLRQWAREIPPTADLVAELCARIHEIDGPIDVKLPKVVRVPEGETYVATEAPLGHAGWFLVSRGDKVPWRLKLRTPSFANLSALEAVLPGVPLEQLALVVASLGYVVGDVAK